jgi:hypothetical protein
MTTTISEGSEELRVGRMLGRYELLMPIAKGGMGSVWAARLKGTRGFRKLVAIKTILRMMTQGIQENPRAFYMRCSRRVLGVRFAKETLVED